MSVATHDAGSWRTAPAILRAALRAVRTAIEAHAQYRVKSAASPSQFQQADRDVRRYRRLIRAGA
jgi:multidrug resistance efflux pump